MSHFKFFKDNSFWLVSAIFYLSTRILTQVQTAYSPLFGLQFALAHHSRPARLFSWSFMMVLLGDLLTGQVGSWTIVTSLSYGLFSFITALFRRPKNARNLTTYNFNQSLGQSLVFTALSTLIYDLITASTGPILFGQAWLTMLVGQTPFTLVHLLNNCCWVLALFIIQWCVLVTSIPAVLSELRRTSYSNSNSHSHTSLRTKS